MSPRRQILTLVAVCFSQFMILLDITIVNVALPAIRRELEMPSTNLVWIVNAYTVALAALILLGGTLGDRYGRKRIFLIGFAVFTAFCAACALSTSPAMLIAFRALQGVGAALMAPLSLSILADAFEPRRRPWAIGMWATIAGLGFTLGPVVGGVLIELFDWSAIFWVNVPVGIAGGLIALVWVRESRDPDARRLDLVGAALVTAALFCLTLGLVETDSHAWTSAFTLGFIGGAIALLAAFFAWEARRADPMLPLEFFRIRRFTVANASYMLLYAALAGTLFFVSLYFQDVKGWSALQTGLSWLVMNVPFLVIAPFAGRLRTRFGPNRVVAAGALAAGIGVLDFALLGVDSPFALAVPGYVLVGLGFGTSAPAVSAIAMGAIPAEHAGVASGVLNSGRQVGAALGLAVLTSIGIAAASGPWHEPGAFAQGMRAAMIVAGAMVLAASALTLLTSGPIARRASLLSRPWSQPRSPAQRSTSSTPARSRSTSTD